jgi:lipopolysaccharide/colanic/teichoic acid biosynthesis glycosyltransferase
MSFVGPRPDVPGYADSLTGDDRQVLELRPGITGPASLLFRDEETILAHVRDPQRFNDEVIYPAKVRINLMYAMQWSFWGDLGYIVATVWPSLSRKLSLEHRLGLDIITFRASLIERAEHY